MRLFLSVLLIYACSSTLAEAARVEVQGLTKACIAKLADPASYAEKKRKDYKILVPGNDNWLFRTETDFQTNFSPSRAQLQNLKIFQTLLADRGIELVIAWPPTRGMIAQAAVPKDVSDKYSFDADAAWKSYLGTIENLNAAGIKLAGLKRETYSEKLYLKGDQHWTRAGADRTARAVADIVTSLPVYDKLVKAKYDTQISGEQSIEPNFGQIIKAICEEELASEKDVKAETLAAGRPPVSQDDLFGDEKFPEVTLVGTSNSNRDHADPNFSGALKQYLQTDIYNAALPGLGIDQPMLIYLSSKEFRDHPPKIIIWEMPGYYTSFAATSRSMDQLIPATLGMCDNAKAIVKDMPVQTGMTNLFSNLAGKDVHSGEAYLALKFNDPKISTLNLVFESQNGERGEVNIRRTKSHPLDGSFVSVLRSKNLKSPLDKISLTTTTDAQDLKISASLCEVPEKYRLNRKKDKSSARADVKPPSISQPAVASPSLKERFESFIARFKK